MIGRNAIVGEEMAATAVERKPWHASFRLLERDERVFAVLLAVVMVGGLAALGLFPLRPRYRIDLYWLVFCFAAYKVGIFALVTVNPRATRAYFIGALGDRSAPGLRPPVPHRAAATASSISCSFRSSPSTPTTSGPGWDSAPRWWRAALRLVDGAGSARGSAGRRV
mgnify:CR=1 FL=1